MEGQIKPRYSVAQLNDMQEQGMILSRISQVINGLCYDKCYQVSDCVTELENLVEEYLVTFQRFSHRSQQLEEEKLH